MVEDGILISKSFESLRDRIYEALQNVVRIEMQQYDAYVWIRNLFSDVVVYSVGGLLYQRTYAMSPKDVNFGTSRKVEMAYQTVEASESIGDPKPTRDCLVAVTHLEEAYNAATGEITLTVIKPGFNTSKSRYYPATVLKRDSKIFEGAKMFANHQTDAEQRARPEGDVRDWVGSLKKVWAEADGTVKGKAVIIDEAMKAKLTNLKEANSLQEMGISIRAMGTKSRKKIDKVETDYIESIDRSKSVDFVTFAGAGGQVEMMESAVVTDENDLDLVTEAQLRERRPDLVSIIESNKEQETMKTQEELLKEAQALAASEKARADKAEGDLREAKAREAKTAAASKLSELLEISKLPDVAKTKLRKQFAEAETTDGMQEAIAAEADYLKAVTPTNGGAGIRRMGATHNVTEAAAGSEDEARTPEETKTKLKESFMRQGLSEKEAKIAAGIKG